MKMYDSPVLVPSTMAPIIRSTTRKTFKFSSLPTELRLMVWRESMERRILHITTEKTILPEPIIRKKRSRAHRSCYRGISTHVRFKSCEKPPVALQICRESRAAALEYYTPSFHSTPCLLSHASEMVQTSLYFNPVLDTVHIQVTDNEPDNDLFNLAYRTDEETIQSIRVLAIGGPFAPEKFMKITRFVARNLHPLQALEKLILVDNCGTGFVWACMKADLDMAKDQLVLQGKCKEWKLPVVEVVAPQYFERDYYR
jgi:hypothetical protein